MRDRQTHKDPSPAPMLFWTKCMSWMGPKGAKAPRRASWVVPLGTYRRTHMGEQVKNGATLTRGVAVKKSQAAACRHMSSTSDMVLLIAAVATD